MAITSAKPIRQEIYSLNNGEFLVVSYIRYDSTSTPFTIPSGCPGGNSANKCAGVISQTSSDTVPNATVNGTTCTIASGGTVGDIMVVTRHFGNAAAVR